MTKSEMKNYKLCSEVTLSECYIGGCNCSSCMYAFPGDEALDLMQTDVTSDTPSICKMCPKHL